MTGIYRTGKAIDYIDLADPKALIASAPVFMCEETSGKIEYFKIHLPIVFPHTRSNDKCAYYDEKATKVENIDFDNVAEFCGTSEDGRSRLYKVKQPDKIKIHGNSIKEFLELTSKRGHQPTRVIETTIVLSNPDDDQKTNSKK